MTFDLLTFGREFIGAFGVNLQAAIASLVGGLLFGIPVTYARRVKGLVGGLASGLISFLRAFPVFVLMFVLLNLVTSPLLIDSLGTEWFYLLILVLALCAYSIAVISDALMDSLDNLDRGRRRLALLFIPNCFRIFTILIIASSIGAAIGLQDTVALTLRTMDMLESRGQKIMLIFGACLFYVAFLSISKVLLDRVVAHIEKE